VLSSQIHDSRVSEDQTEFSHVFLHNVLVIGCPLAAAAPVVYGLKAEYRAKNDSPLGALTGESVIDVSLR